MIKKKSYTDKWGVENIFKALFCFDKLDGGEVKDIDKIEWVNRKLFLIGVNYKFW